LAVDGWVVAFGAARTNNVTTRSIAIRASRHTIVSEAHKKRPASSNLRLQRMYGAGI